MFIDQVKLNYKFFIQLLKKSPWVSARSEDSEDVEMNGNESSSSHTPSTLLSHLLGFKYRFYQVRINFNSDSVESKCLLIDWFVQSPDQDATAPIALHYVSALLIKSGLMRLEDLLPYVSVRAVV